MVRLRRVLPEQRVSKMNPEVYGMMKLVSELLTTGLKERPPNPNGFALCYMCDTLAKSEEEGRKQMLCCVACDLHAHPRCLQYTAKLGFKLLRGSDWTCRGCRRCQVCRKPAEGENYVTQCDGCDRRVHRDCLERKPTSFYDRYYCSSCLDTKASGSVAAKIKDKYVRFAHQQMVNAGPVPNEALSDAARSSSTAEVSETEETASPFGLDITADEVSGDSLQWAGESVDPVESTNQSTPSLFANQIPLLRPGSTVENESASDDVDEERDVSVEAESSDKLTPPDLHLERVIDRPFPISERLRSTRRSIRAFGPAEDELVETVSFAPAREQEAGLISPNASEESGVGETANQNEAAGESAGHVYRSRLRSANRACEHTAIDLAQNEKYVQAINQNGDDSESTNPDKATPEATNHLCSRLRSAKQARQTAVAKLAENESMQSPPPAERSPFPAPRSSGFVEGLVDLDICGSNLAGSLSKTGKNRPAASPKAIAVSVRGRGKAPQRSKSVGASLGSAGRQSAVLKRRGERSDRFLNQWPAPAESQSADSPVCGSSQTDASDVRNGNGRYQCSLCSADFCDIRTKDRHEKNIHGVILPYQCAVCAKAFRDSWYLKLHLQRLHSPAADGQRKGKGRYRCALCSARFCNVSKKNRHERNIHGGIRPFRCAVCAKSFRDSLDLRIHHQRHHADAAEGNRRFGCGICGKTFFKRYEMKQHQAYCEKCRYKCSICGKRMQTQTGLRGHLKHSHPTVTAVLAKDDLVCSARVKAAITVAASLKKQAEMTLPSNRVKAKHKSRVAALLQSRLRSSISGKHSSALRPDVQSAFPDVNDEPSSTLAPKAKGADGSVKVLQSASAIKTAVKSASKVAVATNQAARKLRSASVRSISVTIPPRKQASSKAPQATSTLKIVDEWREPSAPSASLEATMTTANADLTEEAYEHVIPSKCGAKALPTRIKTSSFKPPPGKSIPTSVKKLKASRHHSVPAKSAAQRSKSHVTAWSSFSDLKSRIPAARNLREALRSSDKALCNGSFDNSDRAPQVSCVGTSTSAVNATTLILYESASEVPKAVEKTTPNRILSLRKRKSADDGVLQSQPKRSTIVKEAATSVSTFDRTGTHTAMANTNTTKKIDKRSYAPQASLTAPSHGLEDEDEEREEMSYECLLCDAGFTTPALLRAHVRQKHFERKSSRSARQPKRSYSTCA